MFDKSSGGKLEYQLSMLEDQARTRAFEQAVQESVKPGDIVVDLGCGSGILSCFACRAGARLVYALEEDRVIQLARAVSRDNGFADRIVFFNDRSTRVRLPERVDVVVTETIGNLGFDEGILGWVADARRRFLRPGGILIPRSIALFAAIVEFPKSYAVVDGWSRLLHDLDFSAGQSLAANNPLWSEIPSEACLCNPVCLGEVDLLCNESDAFEGQAEVVANRAGTCHGIGGWFEAKLTDSISISNRPPLSESAWNQGFLPLKTPIRVEKDETLLIRVGAHANGSLWRWEVHRHAGGEAVVQSTLAGQFLSVDHLRKGSGRYVPRLGSRGQAYRFILESMDGSRDLDGIAAAAATRFPEVFADVRDAADLVQRLSRKFSM